MIVMAQVIRPLFSLRTNFHYRLLTPISSIRPNPNPQKQKKKHLPYSTPPTSLDFQSRGLRTVEMPSPSDIQESSGSDSDLLDKKSRNQKKREARQTVKWGMELAEFSVPQIKRIVSVASLGQEVYNAIMLVKKFGPDVREGKRRQFNYIGRLLREAQPELLDALIQATKDGDQSKLQELSDAGASIVGDDEEEGEEIEPEEEEDGNHISVASRWFDGLIDKDSDITKEVYSIHSVEFDRQELRKLVRRLRSIQTEESESALNRAKKPLIRFLQSLAKQMEDE
ncbi:hypothetical protein IFM89_033997 [Coptis chinensis]|uniref:Uncharacterized protein n=1 Tax=Coptis chinensis TaxID=261450 RepID=A0A835MAS9_9MAGN|nr:hypothetical protein IFM89_033997 [Coptis chinensis]